MGGTPPRAFVALMAALVTAQYTLAFLAHCSVWVVAFLFVLFDLLLWRTAVTSCAWRASVVDNTTSDPVVIGVRDDHGAASN